LDSPAALREQAERLSATTHHVRHTVALLPGDPKPTAQAHSIQKLLDDLKQRSIQLTPAVARAISAHIPAVTHSLTAAAQNEVLEGNWAAPDHRKVALRWRLVRPDDALPLIEDLRHADEHVHALQNRKSSAQLTEAVPPPTPRDVLGPHFAPVRTPPPVPGHRRS
jgi:hypothetical protein